MSNALAAVAAGALFTALLPAQNDPPQPSPDGEAPTAARGAEKMLAKYHPQKGAVKVGNVAQVKLPDGWLWLDRADGVQFLVDLGNPRDTSVLGVATPPDYRTAKTFTVYSYESEGHVDDDEAIDAAELLASMQEDTKEGNEQRRRMKLQTVELLGWAEPPHVDKEHHKAYWAKRLRFEGESGETLNYNVRVLGRTGHLVVNGVGDVDDLAPVAANNKVLLEATEFVDGQRYTDFKPEYDKVAAYGIGGLIAGKIALKVGLFAKFAGLLKLAIKPLIAGVVILGAFLAKLFRGKKKKDEEQSASPA